MTRETYPLKLPASIKRAAERLAKEDGVSLNQWIAAAVAEKVGVMETARDFFSRGSQGVSAEALKAVLSRAPDVAPDARDSL
ncbi:MAG: pilus assembly protein HicB [Hyphomonadaceae bacterium]